MSSFKRFEVEENVFEDLVEELQKKDKTITEGKVQNVIESYIQDEMENAIGDFKRNREFRQNNCLAYRLKLL